MNLIAEVKTCSPFGYESSKSFDEQLEVAGKYGDFISIHTDPAWGGSYELVKKASHYSWSADGPGKPILAKGIHRTDGEVQKAIEAMASAVLVVGRLPHYQLLRYCWLEPTTLEQFISWQGLGVTLVWNFRDLYTGMPKKQSFKEVLENKLPTTELIVASYFKHREEVPQEARGVLVGEHLEEYIESIL